MDQFCSALEWDQVGHHAEPLWLGYMFWKESAPLDKLTTLQFG